MYNAVGTMPTFFKLVSSILSQCKSNNFLNLQNLHVLMMYIIFNKFITIFNKQYGLFEDDLYCTACTEWHEMIIFQNLMTCF